MIGRLLSATLLSIALCAGPVSADTVQMVRDGFRICAKHAAQTRKAAADLEEIGWFSQGIVNDLRLFFNKRRDGFAAIDSASYGQNVCAFGGKDMKLPTSPKLGEETARARFGKSMQAMLRSDIDDPGIKAAWGGNIGQCEAGLAVYKEVNYQNVYRGSALMLVFKQ